MGPLRLQGDAGLAQVLDGDEEVGAAAETAELVDGQDDLDFWVQPFEAAGHRDGLLVFGLDLDAGGDLLVEHLEADRLQRVELGLEFLRSCVRSSDL
ncbi:hypothetical protein [Streptomyces sp. PTD9-10]|uniref:hypothetical protein n=1 Tax=Streptomyces sp. PTD9-10 TaxID=3120151 RepID=UPI00300A817E